MNWLKTNSAALQTLAGIATVSLALLALIGVKMQIDYQGQTKIMLAAIKRAKCGSAPICG